MQKQAIKGILQRITHDELPQTIPLAQRQSKRNMMKTLHDIPLNQSPSAWDLLTNPNRVGVFQYGVDQGFPFLNQRAFELHPEPGTDRNGETCLFRIDTLDHVLSAIQHRKLWLPQPSAWEDPWEDPVWRYLEKEHRRYSDSVEYDCFALCWSKESSCEALWRRLKNKGRLVQIKTTVEKLLSSITISLNDIVNAQEQFFLNPVFYMDPEEELTFRSEIDRALKDVDSHVNHDLVRILSLFVKRHYFEYEKEYRLVFRLHHSKRDKAADHYDLNLCPETMIESVQIDPWCGDYEYEMIEKSFELMSIQCNRSDLAKPMWNDTSSHSSSGD